MNTSNQPKKIVYSQVSLDRMLKDQRKGNHVRKFGTVESICKQYGIKYRKLKKCIEFSAPKMRLQMFIEKLHFSMTHYSNFPY